MKPINYKILYTDDIFSAQLSSIIAQNRGLPEDWCIRAFVEIPSYDFTELPKASNVFLQHLKLAETNLTQKFQIVVDSDLDGICSAAILYKFLHKFYPEIETVYSIHTGKQHGLSEDIKIDDDTTLVFCPDSASNDTKQCKALSEKGIDIICLDHHIIEEENPYACIVNCMDGVYPNQNLCGAAVTWLFLYGYCKNCITFFDEYHSYLLDMLDLVAIATISDIMLVTNENNMFFIQRGLRNVNSKALKAFLLANEVPLGDVTIEHIKYKVSPFVSAMIRMGNMSEKTLLFRAFIDDYEEFDYEKRGSFGVETENIYDRVVRLCKNAKGRQDRAKQKLLEECEIHEYPHIVLVKYNADKSSTLTGLVANELAGKYCKPCIVYRTDEKSADGYGNSFDVGSIRNYEGSPIEDFKSLLEDAMYLDCSVQGHSNAAGIKMHHTDPDAIAELFDDVLPTDIASQIGEKQYTVDFEIDSEDVDTSLILNCCKFDHYSGFGFSPVSVLIKNIRVDSQMFNTIGKNTFNWRIDCGDYSIIKFKIQKDDALVQIFDDIDWDSEEDCGKLYDTFSKDVYVDAICTFSLNVYKGEVRPQLIVKDYVVNKMVDNTHNDDDDWDLDLGI